MTVVARRAQRHADRGGDPLDGLVNMFDLGIVLAVAFLIAGISLSQLLLKRESNGGPGGAPGFVVPKDERLVPLKPALKPGEQRVPVGPGGQSVGQVYRLPNGQLVYVTKR